MDKFECYIVTFYNAINYGAVLQTFALKEVISSYCPAHIYKHKNRLIQQAYSINPLSQPSLKTKVAMTLRLVPNAAKKIRFKSFEKKFLTNSSPTSNKLFYIAGSDQIWNFKCSDFDKTYFLDFVDDKCLKNSYAASFGFDEIPSEYNADYIRLLSDYNFISVREKTGQKIIDDLLGIRVPVTLDPTLLLDKQQWAEKFCKTPINYEYILVYAFSISDSMCELINKLSDEKNLPVVILMPEKSLRKKSSIKRSVYKTTVSPQMWVNYFYHASYIVTNSFHGTAFSINFNKPFFVDLLPPPARVNSRITDILESLGLSDRLIQNSNLDNCEIDYKPVNEILENKRKESFKYLKTIVEYYNE